MSSTSTAASRSCDPLAQPAAVAERGVGGGADDEAGRDREAGRGQLAEVRALAAGEVDVGAGEAVEVADGVELGEGLGLHALATYARRQRLPSAQVTALPAANY